MGAVASLNRARRSRQHDYTFSGTFTDRWVASTRPMTKEVQYPERLKRAVSDVVCLAQRDEDMARALL